MRDGPLETANDQEVPTSNDFFHNKNQNRKPGSELKSCMGNSNKICLVRFSHGKVIRNEESVFINLRLRIPVQKIIITAWL